MMAEVEADLKVAGTRSKKRKTLPRSSPVKSESTMDMSSATFIIEDDNGNISTAKKARVSKSLRDVNDDSSNSICSSSSSTSSSSSSSSSSERVYDIDESTPLTDIEIISVVTNPPRTISSESKMRRQALKNRTLKCSACTAGNDAEYIHQVLSIPICGNCNKNVLDDTFGRAENGQELRCTWCGDGEYN